MHCFHQSVFSSSGKLEPREGLIEYTDDVIVISASTYEQLFQHIILLFVDICHLGYDTDTHIILLSTLIYLKTNIKRLKYGIMQKITEIKELGSLTQISNNSICHQRGSKLPQILSTNKSINERCPIPATNLPE